MKRIGILFTTLFIVITSTAFASSYSKGFGIPKVYKQADTSIQVILLEDMTQEMLSAFFEGHLPDTVIECAEGASFPLYFSITGDFFVVTQEVSPQYTIHAQKTFYLRCKEENLLFSLDLRCWKAFEQFFTGSLDVEIGSSENEPTSLTVHLEMNERK